MARRVDCSSSEWRAPERLPRAHSSCAGPVSYEETEKQSVVVWRVQCCRDCCGRVSGWRHVQRVFVFWQKGDATRRSRPCPGMHKCNGQVFNVLRPCLNCSKYSPFHAAFQEPMSRLITTISMSAGGPPIPFHQLDWPRTRSWLYRASSECHSHRLSWALCIKTLSFPTPFPVDPAYCMSLLHLCKICHWVHVIRSIAARKGNCFVRVLLQSPIDYRIGSTS